MSAIVEAALTAIANSLWQSMALVVLTWLALRYATRTNAATRHLVWWAVLAAMVTMPLIPKRAQVERALPPAKPVVFVPPTTPTPAPRFVPLSTPTPAVAVAVRPGRWPALLFLLWLSAFLIQMARLAWSYRYLRGIKRRAFRPTPEMRRDFDVWMLACGVHRPAQLLISREIVSPMAVGFRTPAVVVPEALLEEFNERELDHVLLHELAHIARRDDWSNLAARLGWALFALHPAAAWSLRQIEREREIACDDWVVAATGQARPYAASLARLFELCFTRRRALLATGMAERASQLGERIEMLLRRQREFTARASSGRIAACAGVLVAVLAVASQAPRWIAFAQEPAPAPVASPEPESPETPAASSVMPAAAAPRAQKSARTPAPAAAPAPQPPRNGSFLAALVAAGYGDLSVEDIIALKQNGVTADFLNGVSQSGWGKLPPLELINLHNHGVSAEYLRAMHEAGLSGLATKDVIDLRDTGVNPNYVKDIESAGLGTYSTRQVIEFRQRGVNPELLRALKDEGFHNLEARDIIALRDNGVEQRSLREAKQYGPSLSVQQIIRLKRAGVI